MQEEIRSELWTEMLIEMQAEMRTEMQVEMERALLQFRGFKNFFNRKNFHTHTHTYLICNC
jgi:hypothetical protein